jgi:hypothetical protein
MAWNDDPVVEEPPQQTQSWGANDPIVMTDEQAFGPPQGMTDEQAFGPPRAMTDEEAFGPRQSWGANDPIVGEDLAPESQWESIKRAAKRGVAPFAAGLAGGAAAGELAAPAMAIPVVGPLIVGGAALAGGGLAAYGASRAQEAVAPDLQAAANAQKYPWSTWAAENAPQALFMGPGKGLQLGARALYGGIAGGVEAATEYAREGTIDPARALASGALGAAATKTWGIGKPIEAFGRAAGAGAREGVANSFARMRAGQEAGKLPAETAAETQSAAPKGRGIAAEELPFENPDIRTTPGPRDEPPPGYSSQGSEQRYPSVTAEFLSRKRANLFRAEAPGQAYTFEGREGWVPQEQQDALRSALRQETTTPELAPQVQVAGQPFAVADPGSPFDLARTGELSADRARAVADELQGQHADIENQIFGGNADEWHSLQRQRTRALDNGDDATAERAGARIQELESNLSPQHEAYLNGEGWGNYSNPQAWRDLARNLQDHEGDRGDRMRALGYALRDLPDISQRIENLHAKPSFWPTLHRLPLGRSRYRVGCITSPGIGVLRAWHAQGASTRWRRSLQLVSTSTLV